MDRFVEDYGIFVSEEEFKRDQRGLLELIQDDFSFKAFCEGVGNAIGFYYALGEVLLESVFYRGDKVNFRNR